MGQLLHKPDPFFFAEPHLTEPRGGLFAIKATECFSAWIAVTLLDTRTAPGELKWAASPSEGGVSGSASSSPPSFAGTPSPTCSPFWRTDSHLSSPVWKRWEGRPTASEARCCSANTSCVVWQRSRQRPAWWWVYFKGFFFPFLLLYRFQHESWRYLFYLVTSSRISITVSHDPPPLPRVVLSNLHGGLKVIGELGSYFFGACALIDSHAA